MPRKRTGNPNGRPKEPDIPLGWKPPNLNSRQWKGLEAELAKFNWNKKPWPSTASTTQVARRADVSAQRVSAWRRLPKYKCGLVWLVCLRRLDELDDKEVPKSPKPLDRKAALDKLDHTLRREWRGPVTSPIDGKTYNTLESYYAHIEDASDLIWVGDRHRPHLPAVARRDRANDGFRVRLGPIEHCIACCFHADTLPTITSAIGWIRDMQAVEKYEWVPQGDGTKIYLPVKSDE